MRVLYMCLTLMLQGLCFGDLASDSDSQPATNPQCPALCSCKRVASLQTVDCSYRELTSVPDFSMLQSDEAPVDIYLDGNTLPHVIGTSFWHVGSRIRILSITNNQGSFKIGEGTFSQEHYNIEILKLSPIENDLENGLENCLVSILKAKSLKRLYIETRSSVKTSLENPLAHEEVDLELKVLHIQNSGLSLIGPMALAGMRLRELGLSKNLLTDFPSVLTHMLSESLEILHLDGNKITTLKTKQIPVGCKLRKLFLQNNIISFIEEDTINNCLSLETINLAGNSHLNSLDQSLFVHFENLQLDLRSTEVTRFDFIRSYQIEILLAYNEHRFYKCKEVTPYLRKFGSKLKGVCQHPDSNEKIDIHEICSPHLSSFKQEDVQNNAGESQILVHKYGREKQSPWFYVKDGFATLIASLLNISDRVTLQWASSQEGMEMNFETDDESESQNQSDDGLEQNVLTPGDECNQNAGPYSLENGKFDLNIPQPSLVDDSSYKNYESTSSVGDHLDLKDQLFSSHIDELREDNQFDPNFRSDLSDADELVEHVKSPSSYSGEFQGNNQLSPSDDDEPHQQSPSTERNIFDARGGYIKLLDTLFNLNSRVTLERTSSLDGMKTQEKIVRSTPPSNRVISSRLSPERRSSLDGMKTQEKIVQSTPPSNRVIGSRLSPDRRSSLDGIETRDQTVQSISSFQQEAEQKNSDESQIPVLIYNIVTQSPWFDVKDGFATLITNLVNISDRVTLQRASSQEGMEIKYINDDESESEINREIQTDLFGQNKNEKIYTNIQLNQIENSIQRPKTDMKNNKELFVEEMDALDFKRASHSLKEEKLVDGMKQAIQSDIKDGIEETERVSLLVDDPTYGNRQTSSDVDDSFDQNLPPSSSDEDHLDQTIQSSLPVDDDLEQNVRSPPLVGDEIHQNAGLNSLENGKSDRNIQQIPLVEDPSGKNLESTSSVRDKVDHNIRSFSYHIDELRQENPPFQTTTDDFDEISQSCPWEGDMIDENVQQPTLAGDDAIDSNVRASSSSVHQNFHHDVPLSSLVQDEINQKVRSSSSVHNDLEQIVQSYTSDGDEIDQNLQSSSSVHNDLEQIIQSYISDGDEIDQNLQPYSSEGERLDQNAQPPTLVDDEIYSNVRTSSTSVDPLFYHSFEQSPVVKEDNIRSYSQIDDNFRPYTTEEDVFDPYAQPSSVTENQFHQNFRSDSSDADQFDEHVRSTSSHNEELQQNDELSQSVGDDLHQQSHSSERDKFDARGGYLKLLDTLFNLNSRVTPERTSSLDNIKTREKIVRSTPSSNRVIGIQVSPTRTSSQEGMKTRDQTAQSTSSSSRKFGIRVSPDQMSSLEGMNTRDQTARLTSSNNRLISNRASPERASSPMEAKTREKTVRSTPSSNRVIGNRFMLDQTSSQEGMKTRDKTVQSTSTNNQLVGNRVTPQQTSIFLEAMKTKEKTVRSTSSDNYPLNQKVRPSPLLSDKFDNNPQSLSSVGHKFPLRKPSASRKKPHTVAPTYHQPTPGNNALLTLLVSTLLCIVMRVALHIIL